MKILALKKERKQPALSPERLREHRHVKRVDFLHSMCFMAPSFIGVLIFFILPFLVVVYYSLIRSPLNREFVFLDNFTALLHNTAFISRGQEHAAVLGHGGAAGRGARAWAWRCCWRRGYRSRASSAPFSSAR